jgi:hypothetical protein
MEISGTSQPFIQAKSKLIDTVKMGLINSKLKYAKHVK